MGNICIYGKKLCAVENTLEKQCSLEVGKDFVHCKERLCAFSSICTGAIVTQIR